jgi:hypothetical protein
MIGGARLRLVCNLSDHAAPALGHNAGRTLFATHPESARAAAPRTLAAWSVMWRLEESHRP